MSVSDRGYSVLLNYLHRPSSTIPPLPTLQGLIVHYLSQLAPTPTPLAATIVSSSLFRPFSLAKLEALSASFRHAVHTKLRILQEEPSGIFSPSLNARLNSWSTALLGGLEGGHAITRLACCSGLLLGLEDILSKLPAKQRDLKASVEDEMILAFAEVIDLFTSSDSWGKEFQPVMEKGEHALTLPLIVSSQALLLVPPEKFVALPLPQMLSLVARTITEAFASGTFMTTFSLFLDCKPEYKISVKAGAPIYKEINAIASSHAMVHMGSLSKLCSRIISLFVDYRPKLALPRMQETFLSLEAIAKNVEAGWLATGLADAEEESIAPETRPLTASLWTILKTLLFCTIMITEAGLSATVYVPSALGHSTAALALIELRTLSYLAFVIEKFGGAGHGAFAELKQAFYLALDVLGSTREESEQFVKGICEEIWTSGHVSTHHVQRAKKAFALSAIEQLVPVLSTSTIQTFVLPFCSPHLADAAHRETFESAHSVVLAILSSRSKLAVDNTRLNDRADTPASDSAFTEKMVPFYAQCLIENSAEGKLNVAQLRLAFVTLVRSATLTRDPALGWLCIDSILAACRAFSAPQDVSQRHRLHLSVISSLPSLPLALLSRALSAVKDIVDATPDTNENRKELMEAVFQEILENMGDAEKEYAVRWWNEQRAKWMASQGKHEDVRHTQAEGSQVVLRL
ncbi:hypothetical protein BDN67DRAFT_964560 [Paxillus ammoniavirescens]|nr:hypothetical protein BDN67DRAFT_964560 [Paxillus ammoniavirescens]